MVISEEKKELLRKHFNEGYAIIEYGLNFLDGNIYYVSNIKELNAILDNSENYRYICCHELMPYNDVKDMLKDAKNHGPYLFKYNDYYNTNEYYSITHLIKIKSYHESKICGYYVVLDDRHDSLLHVEDLLKNYIWQDGERCGKLGKLIF